jgi:arylsulfatase A-like enzyme
MATADGKDISELLKGSEEPVREIAVTEHPHTRAMRWKNWRFVHYPEDMFGEDVGELYDIEADPNETRNLYQDPDHQEIVATCRKKLLEWLIRTTRVKTAMVLTHGFTGSRYERIYQPDGDGKIGNLDFRSQNYR